MKIIELKEQGIGLYKKEPHYNTAEFTASAQHFKEFKRYTNHPVNLSPNSQWYKFWVEEARRSLYGYNIGRDWIPGYFYWYLNYCPIEKVVNEDEVKDENLFILPETSLNYSLRTEKKDDPDISLVPPTDEEYESFRAERITGFPDYWDSDYEYFHYLHEAEEAGEHAAVLKTRGRGYSLKGAGMLDRNFYLIPRSKSYAFASEKEYLIADGLLTKTWDMMSHIEQHTPWGKRKSKVDTQMHKRASYLKMNKGIQTEMGFGSEIIGVTFKSNPDKGRGKRGKLILWEEFGKFPDGLIAWNIMLRSMAHGRRTFGLSVAFGCVCKGTKVWDNKGNLINIEDINKENGILGYNGKSISKENIINLNPPAKKECYKITTHTGRILECSNDHPIYTYIGNKYPKKERQHKYRIKSIGREPRKLERHYDFIEVQNLKINDRIAIIDNIPLYGKKRMWNPRLIGWLIGDGSYGHDKTPVLSNCEDEINRYVLKHFDTKIEKTYFTKNLKIYQETRIRGICNELRKIGIYGQTKNKKRLPINIHSYSKRDICELLGGLFDTDGYIQYRKNRIQINITSYILPLISEIQLLLQKLGIHANIQTIKVKDRFRKISDTNEYYRLCIDDYYSILKFQKNIKLYPHEKQRRLNLINEIKSTGQLSKSSIDKGIRLEKIKMIEYIGYQDIYNLTASNTHTYIANGIITHNTGGTDIEYLMALEQLFLRGGGYRVHMIPNRVEPQLGYDKTALFVGEQRNHEIAVDKDGNSHEEVALRYIEEDRRKHLEETKSREMHLRYIAEAPIKPSEALMQIGSNIFPTDLLKQQKAYLLSHREQQLDSAWIGTLHYDVDEQRVLWKIDKDATPIDHYPHNDLANINGCVVIYEPPITNRDGIVAPGLYISGNDNYDHDQSTTDSLGSTFIMNRLTERIVAEYTGRPQVASMFYNTNRYLLQYYNALQNFENNLQGLRNDARKYHAEYLLCDTPDIIKDKIDDKRVLGRGKGTPGTTPIKKYGRELILEWLMREAEPNTGILNLHRIRSVALLDELIYYNDKGNFDRIDALIYLLILHEDKWHHKPDIDYAPKKNLHPFFADNPLFKMNKDKSTINISQGDKNPFKIRFEKH